MTPRLARSLHGRALSAIALLAVGACSSSKSPTNATTGSLTVTIGGQTGGSAASVSVSGPGGKAHVLSTTTTLTGLPVGSYTITARTLASDDPTVSTLYAATISNNPVEVTGGNTASSQVTYGARPGSGGLWMVGGSNANGNTLNWAVEYTASQLAKTGTAPPVVTLAFPLTLGFNIDASGAAIDGSGDLWVVNENSNTAVAYAPAQLGANSSPAPAITLSGSALVAPTGVAFDASGNLWVTNINIGTIVEFRASDLLSSGTPTPALTIAEGDASGPAGLAFDSAGNLWVVHNVASTVSMYAAASLAAGGTITPTITLSGSGIAFPWGIAFDGHGNLWVTNSGGSALNGNIVEFAANLITAGESPPPTFTLTPTGKNGPVITGVAFDNTGDLWFIDLDNSSIGVFTAAQIAGGGTPQPAVVLTGIVDGVGLAFDPHAGALPLH